MATYNTLITRGDAQALIPEEVNYDILTGVENESAALTLFRHIPMGQKQTRMPVLGALPVAYFVNGDTGLKQTTELAWTNKFLNAEEIAVILPIPETVLDDTGFPIWDLAKPLISQAIARTLDAAIFFGTNKPTSWPNAIVTDAATAGNTVTQGTAAAGAGGIAGDLSALMGLVEADGYDVDGMIATRGFKALIRNLRDTTGQRLLDISSVNGNATVDGITLSYPMRGLWPTTSATARLILGDFSRGLLGVRQDITMKILDQAIIQDGTGAIVLNLAQQDSVALRVVCRYAWEVANPINYDQATAASRYPFGVLLAP